MNNIILLDITLFLYFWQLAGCVHIIAHCVTANLFNISSNFNIPWFRFIPFFGWWWNLIQPHKIMMCHYDNVALQEASPIVRTIIGFSGPYVQLIYVIAIGIYIFPKIAMLCGGNIKFALLMCIWQFIYFVWYAIFYHYDKYSDFQLFIKI